MKAEELNNRIIVLMWKQREKHQVNLVSWKQFIIVIQKITSNKWQFQKLIKGEKTKTLFSFYDIMRNHKLISEDIDFEYITTVSHDFVALQKIIKLYKITMENIYLSENHVHWLDCFVSKSCSWQHKKKLHFYLLFSTTTESIDVVSEFYYEKIAIKQK